jgi:hypothetical protein
MLRKQPEEMNATEEAEDEVFIPVFRGTNRNGSRVDCYRVGDDDFVIAATVSPNFPTVYGEMNAYQVTNCVGQLNAGFDFVELEPEWFRLVTGGEA